MKVLILTISAGQGHNKTARALDEYLRSCSIDVEVVDTYKYFNTPLSNIVEKGYLLSTKFTPGIYGTIYSQQEKKDHNNKLNFVDMIGKIVSKDFYEFIEEKNPDAIVATHVFAANLITKLKEKNNCSAKTYGIVTDFTAHPFWETVDLDYYVTPSAVLNNQMINKGIPEEKILPFGIPIESKFSQATEKTDARKALGIEDKMTVFVMTGSMGYGDVLKYVQDLDEVPYDFQIIIVCGNNASLKEQIDQLNTRKEIYNYGFVDNVDVIMDASDVIVSKPGGLTVSEALAKKLPMIIIDPIPGQEERNREFLINNGLAISVSENVSVGEAMYQLITGEKRIECMKIMADEIGSPLSSKLLGDFIIANK